MIGFNGRISRLAASAFLMSVGMTHIPNALAQDDASASVGLEEIVVTARKRSEPLQETPVAVTALSAERIDSLHSGDIRGLNFRVPNVEIVTLSGYSNAASVFMRGIGNADIDSSIDPPVAIFVDGVYMPRPANSSINMFDVEQVEVLRGPQGTLFGRNTTAGAIQFRSRRPSGEYGARAKLTVGEYGRRDLMAAVEAPLGSDKVAAKIAVMSQQYDGYYTNNFSGTPGQRTAVELGGTNTLAVRPTIAFRPSDNFDLTLIGEYQKDRSDMLPNINVSAPTRVLSTVYGVVPFALGQDVRDLSANVPGFLNTRIWGVTADMNWRTGPGTLAFLANYRRSESLISQDTDGTEAPLFEILRDEPHKQKSAELRYSGTAASDRLSYVIGAYSFEQEYDLRRDTFQNPMNAAVVRVLAFTNQTHEARGVFAQADFSFNEQWRATLGGRHTNEKKDFDATVFGVFPATGPRFTANKSWSSFDPKIGVDYRWSKDLMAYASWSKGFKSGGFNGRAGTVTSFGPYDPEEVKAIEFGLKADWLDNRLRTNLAVFHNEYTDLQRTTIRPLIGAPNPQETITSNAASATVKGVELEVTAAPIQGLELNLAVGYNDAGYDEFCADLNGASAANTAPGQCAPAQSLGNGTFLVPYDNSGIPLQRAPEWSVGAGVAYRRDVGGNRGQIGFNLDYNHTSEMNNAVGGEPQGLRPATDLVDASVSYVAASEKYKLTFFMKNLTNEVYQMNITLVPPLFDFQNISEPRRWGLELAWEF